MIKKMLLSVAISIFALNATAQEIYKEVKNLKTSFEEQMNDKSKDIETRKVACFKNDALYYLIAKATKDEQFTEYELGTQTNAMIEFVNLYVKRLSDEKKKKDKEIVMATFRNASISNPLFNDLEKEIIYGYVDNDKYITQFSLDTNWVKALEAVK